jgi:hypothetical protein
MRIRGIGEIWTERERGMDREKDRDRERDRVRKRDIDRDKGEGQRRINLWFWMMDTAVRCDHVLHTPVLPPVTTPRD